MGWNEMKQDGVRWDGMVLKEWNKQIKLLDVNGSLPACV